MIQTRFIVVMLVMMSIFVGTSGKFYADDCDLSAPLLDVEDYPQVTVVAPNLLLVVNADTLPITSEIYVSTADIHEAKISDSGQWVAYLRYLPDNSQELWVTPTIEQEHQLVAQFDSIPPLNPEDRTRPAQILQWEWLPERDTLAYTWLSDSSNPLEVSPQTLRINGSFAASPDGVYLAIQTHDALYNLSLDDVNNVQRITDSDTYQSIGAGLVYPQPYWLPNASAFIQVLPTTTDISGNQSEIRKYSVDQEPELIGTVDANYFNIRVSPTVDRLAYWTSNDDGTTTISISDLGGNNPEVVLSGADIWFDSWAPDGQHFTYRQMRSTSTRYTYLHTICDTQ